ncbi:MAG: prepilin peptidase [Alphaproteobacteria bacterium]|nr:prepilin peptidase [Alphaproteobacteria bacterium]
MAIISPTMVFIVLIVTLLSCISDVRSLHIRNFNSLVILFCFFPAYFASPESFNALWQHLVAMVIMFVVSYVMFVFGMMGGGDSKLGTVLGLWIGLKGLMPFIFYMAIIGGFIGFIALVIFRKKPFKNPMPGSWVAELQDGRNALPYGVAISFGFWAAFFHTGFACSQLNEVLKIIH